MPPGAPPPQRPPTEPPPLDGDLARVARMLRASALSVIGLYPVGTGVEMSRVSVALATALAQLTGRTVAVVDARRAEGAMPRHGWASETRWMNPRIAVIRPTRPGRSGWTQYDLSLTLEQSRPMFDYILVDLAGLDAAGELDDVIVDLDGLIITARAGQVREADLVGASRRLAGGPLLGVLLVSGP